jgi:hypothetical protein
LLDDLAGGVNDTVNQVRNGVSGGIGGSSGAPAAAPAPAPTAAPAPYASTTPPIDGTGPHAQGSVVDVDADLPLTPGTDDVYVGRSRGEQDEDGDYRGEVTIVSALGLSISAATDEGETQTSPLTPINDLLDDVCAGSGNNVCLGVLEYESDTGANGSENSFSAASAQVGNGLLDTGLVTSEGNISDDGECQTAHGESAAANVAAINGAIDLTALESNSDSEACAGGGDSASADSSVADLNGHGLLALLGCDEGTVDDEFGIPALLEGVCNGDDTSGAQTDDPYNVRKALQLEVLPGFAGVAGGLVNADAGSSESAAVAPEGEGAECPDPTDPDCPEPPEPGCPDPGDPACDEPGDGPGDPDGPGKGPGEPGGPSADDPDDADLPFTGADVLSLTLIGGAVMGLGLLGMALADRRRRQGT